ncbi:hypothetical protein R6Q59_010053 [Mikania micrantha]
MPSESSELDKKQNGGMNDDDSKSRTRVSRACTRCRSRKDRCDGQRPSCSACRNAQATCCYEPATKKRGLPEGYVRGLEKLLALLIGKIDGLEDIASNMMQEHRAELLKIWNHASFGEELHTTWKESKIIQELETLLGGLDQAVPSGPKRKREREEDGCEAEEDPDFTFHIKPQYCITPTDHTTPFSQPRIQTVAQAPVDPDLPANVIELVDHYFAYTHCWFPVVDRPQVLRASYELSRGKGQFDGNEAMSPLLWAIFAYTSRQLKTDGRPRSNTSLDSHDIVEQYRNAANAKLPKDHQLLTRVHAQSWLILALLDIGLGKWKSAWSLVGQALRILLCDAAESKGSRQSDSALFQGCAILEIVIASHLGVASHIRRVDFDIRVLINEDGYEEWEPWTAPCLDQTRSREPSFATSCFNRLTEVFLINADILSILSQPEKLDRSYIQSLLEKLHGLQANAPGLMPPSLQSPPHHVYLQLCHVMVQMRLVDLPVDTGAGTVEKAKLACNVLGLLELCKNAKMLGLQHVPPFLIDCVELANKLARSSASSFGASYGLPSYQEFNRTASELVSSMVETWPVFASINILHQNNIRTSSLANIPSLRTNIELSPRHMSSPSTADFALQKRIRSSFGASQQTSTPATSHPTYTSENISLPDLNNWQYPGPNPTPFGLAHTNLLQFANPPQPGPATDQSVTHMGSASSIVGLEMKAGTPSGHLGPAIPEASPSFQGDEIDAIFHEMAHLDTNEWTNERTLGLRDFGFSDDLTFQAFCNDPERLFAPIDGMPSGLSSNSQTWTFAGPNSGMG